MSRIEKKQEVTSELLTLFWLLVKESQDCRNNDGRGWWQKNNENNGQYNFMLPLVFKLEKFFRFLFHSWFRIPEFIIFILFQFATQNRSTSMIESVVS